MRARILVRVKTLKFVVPLCLILGFAVGFVSGYFPEYQHPVIEIDQTNSEYRTLSKSEVISMIQVYGVPHFKINETAGSPVGTWAAVYEGQGVWRIRGAVLIEYKGKDYYYPTTWTYDGKKIILISCE